MKFKNANFLILLKKSEVGYLSYVDVSLGKKVAGFSTSHGRCDIMAHNPSNAIIHLGHSNGMGVLLKIK